MAPRTTIAEVREIFDTALTDAVLTTFITVANGIVTNYLGASTVLSDDEKEEIERFLAAHLASTMRDPQAKQEAVTGSVGASIAYQGVTGQDLSASFYGQTVKMLDRTGILANLKRPASVYAVPSFT